MKEIDKIYEAANQAWDVQDFSKVIKIISEGWEILPTPKENHPESFHITEYLIEAYVELNDFENANKWLKKFLICDLDRIDCGDREFLAGKVAFKANDHTTARKYFEIANKKSEGRCFEGEPKEYQNLIS